VDAGRGEHAVEAGALDDAHRLGFKVAAAPFQIWTPDVYEGAPTPVTALFSAGRRPPRSGCCFASSPRFLQPRTFVLGVLISRRADDVRRNLGALVQTNIKRLLAYSSNRARRYILVAFAAVTSMSRADVRKQRRVCSCALLSAQLCPREAARHHRFALGGTGEKKSLAG